MAAGGFFLGESKLRILRASGLLASGLLVVGLLFLATGLGVL